VNSYRQPNSDRPANRPDTIHSFRAQPPELLIFGGGSGGAGIARDASMRGLKAALVEQFDFAFGTSSRSSRLLHGGLRYLAQGRVGLVREASLEKRVLHRIAPNLSEPLPFVFPTYQCPPWGQWALWKLKIGVKLYDLLCSGKNLGRSGSLNARRLQEHMPGIRSEKSTGAVRYFDGLTNDSRLVLDTLRSAAKAGGRVLNYCRFESATKEGSSWRCVLEDRLTGRRFEAVSRCVVNAAGPWADRFPQSSVQLRPTKGVHLVIDRKRLPVPEAVVIAEGTRILFVIPWGERVILGTTDTDYQGEPDAVRTDAGDIAYILDNVNQTFPQAKLTGEDVISVWAGLRPLIADSRGKPSDISRSHEIRSSQPGWWDVAGGKLTTYRLMGEQTVDKIEKYLGRGRTPCKTALVPILEPADGLDYSRITPPEISREAVVHYCKKEWAIHLDDVMLRRAGWHYYHRNSEAIALQVVQWMSEELGWDENRKNEEIDRYRKAVSLQE
jgi:glycerol-3-phosphate dehydrogenase